MLKKLLFIALAILLATFGSVAAAAEDLLTFQLHCNNGVFSPQKLQVPAGQKFKIEIYNTGTQAIEFESRQLRKEKALSPNSSSFVVVYPLDAGEYKFFDDFHIQVGQGSIVAK
ncbi:MAG: cupredoxin domain-containing protein [Polaromonas sp.]